MLEMLEMLEISGELLFRRTCSTIPCTPCTVAEYEYTVIEQDLQEETISHEIFFRSSMSKPVFTTCFSTSLLHVVCHQLEKRGWGLCHDDDDFRPPEGLKWQCYLLSQNLEKN